MKTKCKTGGLKEEGKDVGYAVLHTHHLNKKPRDPINAVEKAFEKIQYSFMIETLRNLEIKRNYLNVIKSI